MLGKIEGGEGDDRGWDGWMASPTQWTWVWVNSRCWWWTRRPGVLQFIGSQRIGHDWATELNWTNTQKASTLLGLSGNIATLHSQCPHYLCFLFLVNSLLSEMLCVWKFFSNLRSDCLDKSHMDKLGFLNFRTYKCPSAPLHWIFFSVFFFFFFK